MKTTILSLLAVLTVAALAACSQPPPGCQVSAFAPYAAKYAQTTADDGSPCSGMAGDQLGMSSYSPKNKEGTAEDLTKVSMAIRTLALGSLVANAVKDTTSGDNPFAFGAFKSAIPDANDICSPTLASSHQVLDAIPADDAGTPNDPTDDIPGQDAVDIQEDWNDVGVYVTAAAEGTQVKAHYKITDNVAGCSAEYDVLALFPAVDCSDEDADGNLIANEDFCSPVAIPDKGIAVGSGISPDFPTKCEPIGGTFLCVLDADPSKASLPILK